VSPSPNVSARGVYLLLAFIDADASVKSTAFTDVQV